MAFRIADNHAVCDTYPSFSQHLAYPETVAKCEPEELEFTRDMIIVGSTLGGLIIEDSLSNGEGGSSSEEEESEDLWGSV